VAKWYVCGRPRRWPAVCRASPPQFLFKHRLQMAAYRGVFINQGAEVAFRWISCRQAGFKAFPQQNPKLLRQATDAWSPAGPDRMTIVSIFASISVPPFGIRRFNFVIPPPQKKPPTGPENCVDAGSPKQYTDVSYSQMRRRPASVPWQHAFLICHASPREGRSPSPSPLQTPILLSPIFLSLIFLSLIFCFLLSKLENRPVVGQLGPSPNTKSLGLSFVPCVDPEPFRPIGQNPQSKLATPYDTTTCNTAAGRKTSVAVKHLSVSTYGARREF
jgi:hypothetical protein